MKPRSRLVVTGAVIALLATTVVAQPPSGGPFSKFGLKRLRWNPGDTLQVGSIEQGAAAIALTFAHDPDVHALLASIGHRGTRADGTVARFTYPTVPPAGEPKGFWKAVTRPLSSSTPSEILPDSATGFDVWADATTGASRAVFQWRGCEAVGSNAMSFFLVEVAVEIPAAEPSRSEWRSRVIRFQRPGGTEAHTLDEVHAPIVYAQQPGDSGLARILVPTSTTLRLPSTNLSMRLWRLFGLSADLEHPARGQQMQFSALYGGDPTTVPLGNEVLSPFRKILYFATEDDSGYYKRFRHDCVLGGGLEHYRWAPVYFPPYGPAPTLNFFQSPYPAVICALQAKDDAYWFDVTSHYREFVRAELGLTPIRDPSYALNRDFIEASVFVPTSHFAAVLPDPAEAFETYVDEALNFQQLFTDAQGQPAKTFMEWQKWLKGMPPLTGDPFGPGFNPQPFTGVPGTFKEPPQSARDQIARAAAAGINMSMYTIPMRVDDGDWTTFQDDWYLRRRDGTKFPPTPGGNLVDLGHLVVPPWLQSNIYDDIMDTAPSLGGMFLDILGGQGSFLRYPTGNRSPFNFRYHGGNLYVLGGQQVFDRVRERIGRHKTTSTHPDVPFVLTEAAQEFYAGRYDFAQHGLKPLPLQTQLNTILDTLAGVFTRPPVESSMPNPPLWNSVYHEFSRAEALGVMLSTLAVNGALGGGQTNPAFPGLTWQQWGNYMRMVYALEFVQGMKPMIFPYFFDYQDLTLFVNRNGVVEARDPSVPQQVQLIQFLQRLHRAIDRDSEAGRYLASGAAERPLQLPPLPRPPLPPVYSPLVVTTTVNPSVPVATLTDPSKPGALHFYEDAFTTFPYQVAHVLHSVWRVGPNDDRLAIVFVNWSDLPSAWTGTFDPALYDGIDGPFTIKGLRPVGGDVQEYPVAQGNGPCTLGWGAGGVDVPLVHHTQPVASFMPPRSVQVFVVE